MRLRIRATSAYEFPVETFLLLMVEPPRLGPDHRLVEDSLIVQPAQARVGGWDGPLGNPIRRVLAPEGPFQIEFTATVEVSANRTIPDDVVEVPPTEIPDDFMLYTWPSRYCQSDLLARLASSEFGHLPPSGRRVRAISQWVHERVEYRYGTTDARTSAFDTATERIGVCRDFAHLVIAFCRALGIPARYVSGYALDLEPPDFHGYAEVFLGGQWYPVDATIEGTRPALVPIAVGRDAADVAMMTIWGDGNLVEQAVEVRRDPA